MSGDRPGPAGQPCDGYKQLVPELVGRLPALGFGLCQARACRVLPFRPGQRSKVDITIDLQVRRSTPFARCLAAVDTSFPTATNTPRDSLAAYENSPLAVAKLTSTALRRKADLGRCLHPLSSSLLMRRDRSRRKPRGCAFDSKPKINSPSSNYLGRGPSRDGFDVDLQEIIRDWCLDWFARAGSASG